MDRGGVARTRTVRLPGFVVARRLEGPAGRVLQFDLRRRDALHLAANPGQANSVDAPLVLRPDQERHVIDQGSFILYGDSYGVVVALDVGDSQAAAVCSAER